MRSAGDILGRYTLLKRLAGGGMGEVFLATSASSVGPGARIALKVLRSELASDTSFVQMIIDEARISMFLNHQNIVSVLDFAEHDGNYYLAMEYVQGTTVERLMEVLAFHRRKLDLGIALFIGTDLCRALRYAHGCVNHLGEPLHIVHRDVTPANVLLSIHGEVKLTDFGIARAKGRVHQTQAGVMKGKFGYLPPEVTRYESIDARADLFSLGVVLYYLATGQHPLPGASVMEAIFRFEEKRFSPPSAVNHEISPALEAVILKALEPRPSDRWSSAEELGSALHEVIAGSSELRRGLKQAPQALTVLMRELMPEVFDDPLGAPVIEVASGNGARAVRVDSQEFAQLETRVSRPDLRVPITAPTTSSPLQGQIAPIIPLDTRPSPQLVPIDTSDLLLPHDAVTLQGSEFGEKTAIDLPVSEVRRALDRTISEGDRFQAIKEPVSEVIPSPRPAPFLEATTIGDAMRFDEPTIAAEAKKVDFVPPTSTDLAEKAKTDLMLEAELRDPDIATVADPPGGPAALQEAPWLEPKSGVEAGSQAVAQAVTSAFGDQTAVDVQRQVEVSPRVASGLGAPTDISMPALRDPLENVRPIFAEQTITHMPARDQIWETDTVTEESLLAREPEAKAPDPSQVDDFLLEPTQVRTSRIENGEVVAIDDEPEPRPDHEVSGPDESMTPGWRTERWMAGAMDPSELPWNDEAAAKRVITTRNAPAPPVPSPPPAVAPVIQGRIMRGTTPIGPLHAIPLTPASLASPPGTPGTPGTLPSMSFSEVSGPPPIAPGARLFVPPLEPHETKEERSPRPKLTIAAFLAVAVAVGTAAGILTYPRLIRPTLKLITEPPGAAVKINGRVLAERTPVAIEVAPHEAKRVELDAEGYVPETRDVRPLDPGQTYALSVVLRRNYPELRITPTGGTVYIDDRVIGSGDVVRLADLDPKAPIELRVEAQGFDVYRRRFARGSEVPPVLEVRLEPTSVAPAETPAETPAGPPAGTPPP